MIALNNILIVDAVLLGLGMAGIAINRRNMIALLMSLELILLAVNTNFVAFSFYRQDIAGQIFVLFILAVAAAEVAVGLAILMLVYRQKKSVDMTLLDDLRG